MISLKNPEQIGKMRDAGALLYEVLCRLREAVQPGMSTAALPARRAAPRQKPRHSVFSALRGVSGVHLRVD